MVTMYRGSLVSLIYQKTLELQTENIKEAAPVTLMSTDIEQLLGLTGLHEIWACLLELPIGIYILFRQVGLPSLFILIPTIATTLLSGALAPAMEPAQVAWNAAVQARVGQASSMLGQMKGVKMMGLVDYFQRAVRSLRVDEIRISRRVRWLLTSLTTLSTHPITSFTSIALTTFR
jgi:hypothetical protein